jgi:hypothetical protein
MDTHGQVHFNKASLLVPISIARGLVGAGETTAPTLPL